MKRRAEFSVSKLQSMKGITLVSTVVGMAMLAVIAVGTYKIGSEFLIDRKATTIYNGYHGLDEALDMYIKRNFRAMLAGDPVAGVAASWAPNLTELVKQGYLDTFTQVKFQDAGQLSFAITAEPAGCNMASAQCNIAYVIRPQRGVASEAVAIKVLRRIGASGMINDANNVNLARGWDGRRTMVSPVPVPNALFVTRVYPSSYIAAALPKDGSRPLTDDWDLGTKKLTGVGMFSTDKLRFTSTVTEGDPCTNTPGYKSLTMGTNGYLQICKPCPTGIGTSCWVHANEEITIVKNTVIHTAPPGGWGGSSSSGGRPGYLGLDGRLYNDANQTSVCNDCNRPDGTTNQRDAVYGSNNNNNNNSGCSGSCNAGGGVNPSAPPYTTNPSVGPGSGGTSG